MKSRILSMFLAIVLTTQVSAEVDTRRLHVLSGEFLDYDFVMDVVNGGPDNNVVHMTRWQNHTGQLWRIVRDGRFFRLTSQFRGPRMCLDVGAGRQNTGVLLLPCGNFSGQLWSLHEVRDHKYRMTTEFLGPDMCLDVGRGGPDTHELLLAPCGNYSGQFWSIEAVR